MKSEKLAVLIADGDRDYEVETLASLERKGQRTACADAGGSSAPSDRSMSDEEIQTLLSRGKLRRDERDIVIVALEAKFGNRIRRSLCTQVRSILGGPGALDQDDILQEMWVKVAGQVANGGARDVENLGGWLYRIAQGCLIDYVRSRKSERGAIMGRFMEMADHRLPSPSGRHRRTREQRDFRGSCQPAG